MKHSISRKKQITDFYNVVGRITNSNYDIDFYPYQFNNIMNVVYFIVNN